MGHNKGVVVPYGVTKGVCLHECLSREVLGELVEGT